MKSIAVKKIISIIVLPLALAVSAQAKPAKMQEIKAFSQVLDYVKDKDTVLILSIDNALLKSPKQFGQRLYYYYLIDKYKTKMKEKDATQKALAEWTGILNLFGQQPVADDVAKTIDQIQKKFIKVIGISSRGLGLASLTVQHLSQAGIDLGRTSGIKQDMPVILGEKTLLYRNGILFTSGVGKAIALKKLFELTKVSQPKKIVMVSHDERTLKLVAEGVKYHGKGVEFVPLRYTLMDAEIKKFDPQIAVVKFVSLIILMNDLQEKEVFHKAKEEKLNSKKKK